MGTCVEVGAAESSQSKASRLGPEPFAVECIHQLFEAQAEKSPETPALIFENRQLTYAGLNARANQLAHHLRRRGIGRDSIVALRIERSLEMMVGILGILKAGAAYLPVDPGYPAERQQFMLNDSGAALLLTKRGLPALQHRSETVYFDSDSEQLARESTVSPERTASGESLAYVIYTSGSTGKPKGVLVSHDNLVHSTAARFRYYPEPVENYLLLSSFAFDSSVAGIFWTLCSGGTLTLPHEYSQLTASELADLIARHRISHLLCLPSLHSVLLDQHTALGSLQVVIVAGESCPPALVKRHHELLPRAALYNEYGPTEATVWSTVYRCDSAERKTIPIGRPIPGAEVHILGEDLKPVRNGDAGELYVGGPGVTLGYLNRPELTAGKFVLLEPSLSLSRLYRTGDLGRYLPDGNIEFLGRVDNQVKIRGHRIELEEIEAAIRQHDAIQDAVVVARKLARAIPHNGNLEQFLFSRLSALPDAEADALLAEVRRPAEPAASDAVPPASAGDEQERRLPQFDVSLRIKKADFIRPPRDFQRNWLLSRALDEFAADLLKLDALARRFVPGLEPELRELTGDRTQAELAEDEIMEDWHIPLMKAMARAVTETHGDILEIGFGRGIASTFLQNCGVRSHTIIECNDSVIRRFFEPWRGKFSGCDIRLVRGRWQDVIEQLGTFDGIFFQTFPLNEREFVEYLSKSATFAEHFFPVAVRHLNRGGAFTYLTHEIDSLSRRHQRLLLQHFSSLNLAVQPLRLPADCKDLWWADSMVVVKAIK